MIEKLKTTKNYVIEKLKKEWNSLMYSLMFKKKRNK